MKKQTLTAIVLRRTNFGEADRIVNFITPEGKISAIARGARRQKSKLAGGIEIFTVNEIVVMTGKSELKTLISARMKDNFSEIIKDLDRVEFGYQAIKKINAASENIDNPSFFEILLNTFKSLNNPKISMELIKNWFSLNIKDALGDGANLNIDSQGFVLEAESRYNYDPIDKVFVRDDSGAYDARHIKFLRLMISAPPTMIAKVVGCDELMTQVADIFNSVKN